MRLFSVSEGKTAMKKTVLQSRRKKSLEDMTALLREKLPELQRIYGVTSMEIFGSWVRGEQTGKSDLDILVEFDPVRKISLFGFVSLEQELSDYLGIPIDLVEKNTIKPALRRRILNEAIPL
jgi:predicted nucleotidyltransferase